MLIPMRVKTVTHTPGAPSAVAVLETLTDDRTLALTIPLDEAHRLARALGLGPCRCAPIYDLVEELLTALDTTITRAVLEAQENGIGAALTLGVGTQTLSCHPADALALALRSQGAGVRDGSRARPRLSGRPSRPLTARDPGAARCRCGAADRPERRCERLAAGTAPGRLCGGSAGRRRRPRHRAERDDLAAGIRCLAANWAPSLRGAVIR
jgi:bifunctional DNase/RNase